jgi:hypothetical protein
MTQQEFVKKMDKPGVYIGAYADGLTKGLEIAKDFAEWLPTNRWRHTIVKATTKTTDELLTIFLTEKYGQ